MRKIIAVRAALLAAMLCSGFAGNAVADAVPHIWISPHPGSPGDTVKIYGRDFGPKETVDIYFDKIDVAQVVTWKGGGFGKVPLTVPADALIGKHHITAVGRTSGDAAKKQFIVQAAWRELGFTAEGARYNPYETTINAGNVGNLTPLWTAQTAGSVYSSPAVAYGMVYVGSNDGNLYAFDAMTGATKWMATTGAFLESSPAVANGVVYVGSGDGHLYAFDAITGATKWTANAGYSFESSPAVANGKVFAGAGFTFYAFDAATGATLWTKTYGTTIDTSPAVANDHVWIGDSRGPPYQSQLEAYNVVDGTFANELDCGNYSSPMSSPATSGEWVYSGTQDGHFCAMEGMGSSRWWITMGGEIDASPAVANGVLYVTLDSASLYAVNATTGAILWTTPPDRNLASSPAVANGVVFVGSYDGYLFAFDAANGTQLWAGWTGHIFGSSPSVANGVVYVGSTDGKLSAFALNGGHAAVYHRDTPMPSFTTLLANRKAMPKPH